MTRPQITIFVFFAAFCRTDLSDFVSFFAFCKKIILRDEGVAFTATANRKFATANPSRGGRGTLAPLYDG
jgi:hypothetical protein